MASTSLATISAATAAGYVLVQISKNDGTFRAEFEKSGLGTFNKRIRAAGEGSTANAATTAALAALNSQRQNIYGVDNTAFNRDNYGNAITVADS